MQDTATAATAGNDSWNAFESADDSSKPAATTAAAAADEPYANGDSSWANFVTAPAPSQSDPVAVRASWGFFDVRGFQALRTMCAGSGKVSTVNQDVRLSSYLALTKINCAPCCSSVAV